MHGSGYYYGWRGKFGFISPSMSDTVALEFYRLLPDGVLVTCVDQKVQRLVDDHFDNVIKNFEDAVKVLDFEGADIIIVGGTPPLLRAGFGTPERIISEVRELTGKPASTTPTAEVNALRSLGLRRIVMVTPLQPHLNDLLKRYLEHKEFDVVHVKGANIEKNADIVSHPPSRLYQLVREAVAEAPGPVDGVFVECPRWGAVEIVESLENDLGIPVVTTAQALVRDGLQLLRINEIKPHAGRLFHDFAVR